MVHIWNKRTNPGIRGMDGHAVLVDRTTKWGNPFVIPRGDTSPQRRNEVIASYRDWISTHPEAAHLRRAIRRGELTGKDLICWCAPQPCHAEVLAELAEKHG